MRHFKAMLRKVDNTYVRDHKLGGEALEALKEGETQSRDVPHDGSGAFLQRALRDGAKTIGSGPSEALQGCDIWMLQACLERPCCGDEADWTFGALQITSRRSLWLR